eukprot:Pgem_evm1s18816
MSKTKYNITGRDISLTDTINIQQPLSTGRVVSPEDFRDHCPDPEFPDRSETPFGRFKTNRTDPKKSPDRFG